jgi:CopG family nickel-responsive transcriptional regulator
MSVTRFGVSLEEELLQELDDFVTKNSFSNRSQAIRFLIEKNIVETKWQCNNKVAGAILLMYDFKKSDLAERISKLQFDNSEYILSCQRFFPNEDFCMEIIVVKGVAHRLTELSDKFIGIKGMKHGKLIMSRTD